MRWQPCLTDANGHRKARGQLPGSMGQHAPPSPWESRPLGPESILGAGQGGWAGWLVPASFGLPRL